MRKLILASASPRRKQLLETLGVPFTIEPSDYEEDMTIQLPPRELAEVLATGKAEAVAIKHADAVVIAADTFLEFDGKVIGKPYTAEKATATLRVLSGKPHFAHTGYCIVDTKTGEQFSGVETIRITLRELSDQEIADYVATGEPLLAAGAYMVQSGGAGFVEHLDGEYAAMVGLPLAKITPILKRLGVARAE